MRRIQSIALVHETLSREAGEDVAFTEILRPLVQMVAAAVSSPDRQIDFEVRGEAGTLPAEVATPDGGRAHRAAAEHRRPRVPRRGGARRAATGWSWSWTDGADEFVVRVIDNGVGVPPDFSVEKATGLGLSIVRALVTSDLRGTIDLFEPPDGSPGHHRRAAHPDRGPGHLTGPGRADPETQRCRPEAGIGRCP